MPLISFMRLMRDAAATPMNSAAAAARDVAGVTGHAEVDSISTKRLDGVPAL